MTLRWVTPDRSKSRRRATRTRAFQYAVHSARLLTDGPSTFSSRTVTSHRAVRPSLDSGLSVAALTRTEFANLWSRSRANCPTETRAPILLPLVALSALAIVLRVEVELSKTTRSSHQRSEQTPESRFSHVAKTLIHKRVQVMRIVIIAT